MPTGNGSFMDDFEEDWEDPLLDVSTPYKSFAPLELGCLKLDEDLQDLISFFSRISRKEYIRRMKETAFETNLRVLKNALLVEPQKYDNRLYNKGGPLIPNDLDMKRGNEIGKPNISTIEDRNYQNSISENRFICSSDDESLTFNVNENVRYVVGGKVTGPSEYDLSLLRNASKNGKLVDHSEHLMVFFRELETAQLFDNLEAFSGILTAHTMHLRIIQEIVSDIFKVEELRLRLCSQLSALIDPVIFSRLMSYNNSLFCTAFTVPKSENFNSKISDSEICSIPNPRQYKWPSSTSSIEDYKQCMSKLPLICFSEKGDLWSCVRKSFMDTIKIDSPNKDIEYGDGCGSYNNDCSVRIRSLNFIFTEDFYKSQMNQPLFIMDGGAEDDTCRNSTSFHHPLCMDIAQDSKDIERDIIYINGKEYNGSIDGYEAIVFTVASLIENYWLVNFKLEDEIVDHAEMDVTETLDFRNKFMNEGDRSLKGCEEYEHRSSGSVLISIILIHILSRTYSGGACFDKVSLVYNNPECIVISPYSKRARPLELVILPNIALMLSTLRFRLYEVLNNLTANTMPCFLVDTHVVSRLMPNSEFINSLSLYSIHILSRTSVNKIPSSIFFHLVKMANSFVMKNALFTRIKMEMKSDFEDKQVNLYIDPEVTKNGDDMNKSSELVTTEHQYSNFTELLDVNFNGVNNNDVGTNGNNCIDTERIIEATGDDLTIITPGEAALFRMFTNIQEKELISSNADGVQKNLEESLKNKIGDSQDSFKVDTKYDSKRSSFSLHSNNCSKEDSSELDSVKTRFEFSGKLTEVLLPRESENSENLVENVGADTPFPALIDKEPKNSFSISYSGNLAPIEKNEEYLDSDEPIYQILSPDGQNRKDYIESDEFESKENNEQQSVVLEGNATNRAAPRLFLSHDHCNLQSNCIVNSNIYIASSQNTPDLANDLQNLPSDSIGAIDVENQQYTLFLQSKRVVTQFGIFNIINA